MVDDVLHNFARLPVQRGGFRGVVASGSTRLIVSCRASAAFIASGCCSQSWVLPSISVKKKVTVPVGNSGIRLLQSESNRLLRREIEHGADDGALGRETRGSGSGRARGWG